MRIESVELRRIQIPFKQAFQHATKARVHSDAVLVCLRDADGNAGYGEILPRPYLTGETLETVAERDGPLLARRLLGRSLASLEEVRQLDLEELDLAAEHPGTFAGFELALVDLTGQALGFSAGELLGRPAGEIPPPGAVVGFDIKTEKLERHCATLRMAGRRHVKLKVGLDDDPLRAEVVNRILKPEAGLRIDVNGIWSAEEAIRRLGELAHVPLASVEQPVPKEDLVGMRRVREATGLAVMADESLCTLADARRLLQAEAVDIFNVRLGKCGGFLGSLRLVDLATNHGLSCHLGTLVGETGILSRASEIFGSHVEGFACLEGRGQNKFLLDQDVLDASPSSMDLPGLGVSVDPNRLEQVTVTPPQRF